MHFSKVLPIAFATDSKPFHCTYCRKEFSHLSSLESHLEHMHAKDSKHACEACGKSFSSKSNLTAHRKIHSGKVRPTDRPRPSKASCSPRRSSHYTYFVVLSQVRGRSNAWCATSGFGRRRIYKSTRPPTPQRPRSSARCVTRHSATSPTSTRTWQRTVT